MTRFLGIEKGACGIVAILEDFGEFQIDKHCLKIRIRNLKRGGGDATEEEKALKALEEEW